MLNLFWYAGKNDKKIKYYKVWQEGNDAKEIHSSAFLDEKTPSTRGIHQNPVKAELVGNPEDYCIVQPLIMQEKKDWLILNLFEDINGSKIRS